LQILFGRNWIFLQVRDHESHLLGKAPGDDRIVPVQPEPARFPCQRFITHMV